MYYSIRKNVIVNTLKLINCNVCNYYGDKIERLNDLLNIIEQIEFYDSLCEKIFIPTIKN